METEEIYCVHGIFDNFAKEPLFEGTMEECEEFVIKNEGGLIVPKEESKGYSKTPKVGDLVIDDFDGSKRKVKYIDPTGRMFFIGPDHEPVFRHEFTFPIPK